MLCCRKNRKKIRRKDTELCLICMDESKKIFKHSCQVCKKNAWKICKECDRQLINCPVCRTSFNRHNKITNPISIITDVNNNTTNISSFQRSGKCINKNRCLSFCLHTWQKIKSSSFYKTEPLDNENQPSFLNIVIELETTFTAFQLLDKIREIEKMLGREEIRQKNHPRTIDIDIIIFKDSFIDTPELQIPHPGALLRKFVLIPLAELASDEIFPKTNIKIVDLLEKCPDTSVVQKYIIDKKA